MGSRSIALGALVVAVMVVACTSPSVSTVAEVKHSEVRPISSKESVVPGEWIVTVKPGVSRDLLVKRYAVLGILDVRRIMDDRYHLRFRVDVSLTEQALLDAGQGDVLSVQPNYRYRPHVAP